MVELSDIERKINKVDEKLEENTFALEIMREQKLSNRRKDIIHLIIIILLIIAVVGTNLAWLIHENNFETIMETDETTLDAGNGIATYLENSKSGDINYGENN